MKKILKVCAVALSMALLFASCANDSTPAPDYYDINVPAKPEGYKPSENVEPVKDGTTAFMLSMPLFNDILSMVKGDEEYVYTQEGKYNDKKTTKGYFIPNLLEIGLIQEFTAAKKANSSKDKFSADLTGNYKAANNPNNKLNINFTKCVFGYESKKETDSITYSGFANINGNIKYDLTNHFNIITKDNVKDHEWKDENSNQNYYQYWDNDTQKNKYLPLYLRESHVKTLSGKVIVNGDAKAVVKAKIDTDTADINKFFINENNYVDSVSGKLSTLVNLSGFFDTGVYNGILNIRGKLSNSDLNKLYINIQNNTNVLNAIQKIIKKDSSEENIELLVNFLDTNSVSFKGEISISDMNGRNTQSVARFESFKDIHRYVKNMEKEKA